MTWRGRVESGGRISFSRQRAHLWLVISEPSKDRARVLLVNVTSWRQDKDQGCLLGPADHPEIEHNSCIYFVGSRVYSDSHLNHLYNTEKIVLYDPLRPEVLRRVREAAAASRTMRLDHKQILFDQELVDC